MWRSVLALALTVVVGSCGDNDPGPPKPASIQLSMTTATLELDATVDITASYRGTVAFAPDDILWESSAPTEVTVTPNSGGKVTLHAVSAGHATITATGEGLTATLEVTVTPAHLVSIAADVQPHLAAGTTLQIHVTGSYSDGSTADVTQQTTLTTERPAIATVSSTGLIAGIKKGDTPLHADLDGKFFTTLVTVTAAKLVSLAITPDTSNVPFGLSPSLVATGTFTDSSTQDLSSQVTWTSSLTTIVTVSVTGKLTTVAVGGPSTITATKGTITTTASVTVTNVALVSILVTPDNPTVALGSHPQFTAMGTYSDATIANLTSTVTWDSATVAVATIDAAGKATTLTTGSSIITATLGAVSDTSLLTVGPAVLATVVVSPTDPTIALGQAPQFTAVGTNTDATIADISTTTVWSSGTPAVATIDAASGLATSLTTGASVITATVGTVFGTSTLTVGP